MKGAKKIKNKKEREKEKGNKKCIQSNPDSLSLKEVPTSVYICIYI
jgi:hypothetical protein